MISSKLVMPSREKIKASALRALDRLYSQMLLDIMRSIERGYACCDCHLLERAQYALDLLYGKAAKIHEEIRDKISKAHPHDQALMKRSLAAALDLIKISEGLVDKHPNGWHNLVDEIIEVPSSMRYAFRDFPRQEYIVRYANPEALTHIGDFAEVLWASKFSPIALILISPNKVSMLRSLEGIFRVEPSREATFSNEPTS